MDYALAIKRNRDQLKEIVLALFVLARMRIGGSVFALPRSTFAMIMLVLRPAESAVRRLIVIAAHGLALKPQTFRSAADLARLADLPTPGGDVGAADRGARTGHRAFPLFDPLKHFDPEAVWDAELAWDSGFDLTASHGWHDATLDDTPLDATHLGHRLNALIRALDNIPAQARRLFRWQAKRDARIKARKPTRMSPIRPGFPPGWRERRLHEIDDILRECHGLAHDRLYVPDTS